MCSRATRRRHKNIPLIINQYFRAKYTQINCVPFQVIQVKHQAVGRRRENKNAVALDSEQVTNLCFNTSTAFWRFGMKQPAALVSPGREATTGNTSAVRRLGMKQLTKIPSFTIFLTPCLCRTRVECTCRRPYQPLVYHQLPRIMCLNHLSHNWFWQLLLNHSLYRTYKLICLSFIVFFSFQNSVQVRDIVKVIEGPHAVCTVH